MYLSKVVIHDKKSLVNPYDWHRALWTLFPGLETKQGEPSPFLYRVEKLVLGQQAHVLMQSSIKPQQLSERAQVTAEKEYEPILKSGMNLGFTLQANPTKTIRDTKNPDRKLRVPYIKEEEQTVWLQRKLEGIATLKSVLTRTNPPLYFSRRKQGGKIVSATFDGVFHVNEPEKFVSLMRNGIGPAKAFGCGLLLVRKI